MFIKKNILKKLKINITNSNSSDKNLLKDKYTNVYYFNPKRLKKNIPFFKDSYIFKKILSRRLNNFGDLLGPIIVKNIFLNKNIQGKFIFENSKLLTVGSIIHFAKDYDHIWGSGINGKVSSNFSFQNLNIYSVRGPLTRELLKSKGFEVPEIYGDPAILFGYFFPEYKKLKKRRKYLIIPNYNDKEFFYNNLGIEVCSPLFKLNKILKDIAQSEIVITSSLHGIVLADSFGVDSVILKSHSENEFKYKDYLFGTGRDNYMPAESLENALNSNPIKKCEIDYQKLIDSFPLHLYQ